MTVLIEVRDERGAITRRCDARCHRADPDEWQKSKCVCGGYLRGIERKGIQALDVSWEELAHLRECIVLRPGEHVQFRIGA